MTRSQSRSAASVTSEYTEAVKKAWLKVAQPKALYDIWEASEQLQDISAWIDTLAEDLLFNKGFFHLPLSEEHPSNLPQDLKVKVVGELKTVQKILKEALYEFKSKWEYMVPDSYAYKMNDGAVYNWYANKDPRSPTRAFNKELKVRVEEELDKASKVFTQKFLRALNSAINRYGPIDFGEKTLEFSLGKAKIIFQDFRSTMSGPLGTIPEQFDATARMPRPEAYVRYFTNAQARLERHGLGFLWYGLIYIQCKKCGGSNPYGAELGVAAHYVAQKDEIVVFSDPTTFIEFLMLHEIGHRYYYRYMNQGDRARFDSYFIGLTQDKAVEILRAYRDAMVAEDNDLVMNPRLSASLLQQLIVRYFDKLTDKDQLELQGWVQGVPATSSYGAKASPEDFAEVFASYLMGQGLSRSQSERFKVFLGAGRTTKHAGLDAPYLKKLLTYLEAQNTKEESYWRGSWEPAIREVRRWMSSDQDLPSMEELVENFEVRGLPSELAALIRKDMPPPRAPRTQDVPALFQKAIAALTEALPPRARLVVHAEHTATLAKVKELMGWVLGLQMLKAKHPKVWAVASSGVQKVMVEVDPKRSALASWGMYLTLNLHGHPLKGSMALSYLLHEMGHVFEDAQSDSLDIAMGNLLYGHPPFSHALFEDRPVEDFAECFRQFFAEPRHLLKQSPDKFADMQVRLDQ